LGHPKLWLWSQRGNATDLARFGAAGGGAP